jgi:hypothetical protein
MTWQTSHILSFHYMNWLCLQWKEIYFWQSCYMLLPYLVTVDKDLELVYPSFMSLRSRKCLNILDINCFPLLSCMHACMTLLGFPLIIIIISILPVHQGYQYFSFFQTICWQLFSNSHLYNLWCSFFGLSCADRTILGYPSVPYHLDASLQIACTFCS